MLYGHGPCRLRGPKASPSRPAERIPSSDQVSIQYLLSAVNIPLKTTFLGSRLIPIKKLSTFSKIATFQFTITMDDPDDVLAEVKERGHFVVYADVEKVATKTVSKGSRVIVITESVLFVYHKKSKKLVCEHTYLFLEEMSCKNTRIKLVFDDDVVTIDSQNAPKIMKKLRLVLSHFLTEFELEKFGLTKPENQSSFAILMRMHAILDLKKTKPDHSTMNTFTKAILYRYPRLALSEGNEDAVRVFLRILPLCTFLVEVHFPEFEFNEQEFAWLAQCQHLKYVSVTGKVDWNVLEFLKMIHVSACAFSKSDMSIDELKAVKEVPGVGNGFHKAFSLTTFQYFTTDYLATRNIAVLNMDATPNLNVRAVLQSLENIVLLSMSCCNLEVSNTMHDLEMFELKKLRYVNISGNRCNLRVNEVSKLPPLLFGLNVTSVQWGDGCLVNFFEMVFKHFPNGLRLYVGDAEATYQEWANLGAYLGTVERTTLASLSWNGNPMTPQFIHLLERSPFIEYLSVNRCFKYLESKMILRFAKTLRNFSNLKYFCARGSKSYFFGPYLYLILTALLRCPVEIVDIRNSGCGDICLERLKEFILGHPTLRIVDIDGVVPTNFDKYVAFMREILKKPELRVSYPENDINKITDPNLASSLKGLLVLDGDTHIGKPFYVYKYVEAPIFPRVVSNAQLAELRRDTVDDGERHLTLEEIQYIGLVPPVLCKAVPESADDGERMDADLDHSALSDGFDEAQAKREPQDGAAEQSSNVPTETAGNGEHGNKGQDRADVALLRPSEEGSHSEDSRETHPDKNDEAAHNNEEQAQAHSKNSDDANEKEPGTESKHDTRHKHEPGEGHPVKHMARETKHKKTPKKMAVKRRHIKTLGDLKEKPEWEMPELTDAQFDQKAWSEKRRPCGVDAVCKDIKKEDEE